MIPRVPVSGSTASLWLNWSVRAGGSLIFRAASQRRPPSTDRVNQMRVLQAEFTSSAGSLKGSSQPGSPERSAQENELQAAAKAGDKAAVDKMLAEGRAARVAVDTKLFV